MRWGRSLVTTAIGALLALTHASMATPLKLVGSQVGLQAGLDSLLSIDRDSGVSEVIGAFDIPVNLAMSGLAYNPTERILYGLCPGDRRLYTINVITGHATPIGLFGSLGVENANGLAYDSNHDILYAVDTNTGTLLKIDRTTGLGTPVVVVQVDHLEGLAYDPATDTLYGLEDSADYVVRINPATGGASRLPVGLGPGTWRGLEFDPERQVLYATQVLNQDYLYRVDPMTGMATVIGPIGAPDSAVQGLAMIPEPATLAMIVVGMVLMRHRKSRTQHGERS